MAYINTQTLDYPIYEADIRRLHPNTSFATPFNPDGYAVVFSVPMPTFDSYTQRCQEVQPAISTKGNYEQVYTITELTGEDLEAGLARKAQNEAAALVTKQKALETALENHIDAKAQSYTWKNITSALAAASRPGVFQTNAILLANWWEACWVKAHEVQTVAVNTGVIPTVEEFIASMPVFEEV